jgi:hypothetical protein
MSQTNSAVPVPEPIRRDRHSSESNTVAPSTDAIRRDHPDATPGGDPHRPGASAPRPAARTPATQAP